MRDVTETRSKRWLLLGVLGFLVALAAILSTLGDSLYCSWENNVCAPNHTLTSYRGRLFDFRGRPASSELLYEDELYGHGDHAVSTDRTGRFCVRAVAGGIPFIYVPGHALATQVTIRSDAPVDPRFSDPVRRSLRHFGTSYRGPDRSPFMIVEPVLPVNLSPTAPPDPTIHPGGANDATRLWNPTSDAAHSCQGVGATPPWWHFRHSWSSWQFAVLMLVPLMAALLFAVGVVLRIAGRARAADLAFRWTCAGSALAVGLMFVLRG
jgi:hypothetical protein